MTKGFQIQTKHNSMKLEERKEKEKEMRRATNKETNKQTNKQAKERERDAGYRSVISMWKKKAHRPQKLLQRSQKKRNKQKFDQKNQSLVSKKVRKREQISQ